MNSTEERKEQGADGLIQKYLPLGIRAVLAASTVKPSVQQPKPSVQEPHGRLPAGFHMPHDLDD